MSNKLKILTGPGMSAILAAGVAPAAIVAPAPAANTLTGLIPDLYAGLDQVSRELVGFIPSVARDSTAERAAVGQSVVSTVSKPKAAKDIVPAMQIPEPRDTDRSSVAMTITKSQSVEFGYTGEEMRGLNSGPGAMSVQADEFAQAVRTLVNSIEADVGTEAAANASRAVGTSGNTPYATDLEDSALLRKVLDDNGAPLSGRSQVINTAAGAKLRTLENLTNVNEAGTSMTLRDGELLNIHGFSVKESAGVVKNAVGTAAATATTDATGYAVGTTEITLAATGTGTIITGDVITFAGDSNQYFVAEGDTDVSGGGTITLAAPGLRVAIPAAATAITLSAEYSANVGFSRNALQLAMRAPALPNGDDAALDRRMIVDARSGLMFEVSLYQGYRMIMAEVSAAWGVKAIKPEHIAILKG